MEINENLSEFVWEYIKTHGFASRTTISGIYIDKFGIGASREERKPQQKRIERKIASLFVVMKKLGIASRFSSTTMRINRGVFNAFSLQDVLTYNRGDCVSKKSVLIDIV